MHSSTLERFEESMVKQGRMCRDEIFVKKIEEFGRKSLFPNCPFITSGDLLYGGSLSRFVTKHFQVSSVEKRKFWETYSYVVKRTISQRRDNVSSDIGKAFVGKWKTGMHVETKELEINAVELTKILLGCVALIRLGER